MKTLEIPVLLVDGWYDYHIDNTMHMWERIPEETRRRSALFVGPYGHATSVSKKAEYPLEHGNLPDDYIAEWFDSIREN